MVGNAIYVSLVSKIRNGGSDLRAYSAVVAVEAVSITDILLAAKRFVREM